MNDTIGDFWRCFCERESDLARVDSADAPVYDEILAALQRINSELYFEFCSSPGVKELIITAGGNSKLFPLVEQIVHQAPDTNWKIFALKPKLGFPITTCWEGTEVTIGDVLVVPVFRETGEMGLRLYIPNLNESNEQDIHNALLRALDSGLGERRFAECVEATWVYCASEAPSHAFPLTELDGYIN